MRFVAGLHPGLALLSVLFAVKAACACDQLPANQSLWVRLASPISTYSAKPGDPVRAVLTQDLVCDDEVLLPLGTQIDGVVQSNRKVGWGIRHETAALAIEFDRATVSPNITIELKARIAEVRNAREQVHGGVIEGIRSTNTFQGTINSRLIHMPTWNPYTDPVLMAYKALFPIFPEPEIYYPAGTDLRLQTAAEILVPPEMNNAFRESALTDIEVTSQVEKYVHQLPSRVTTLKGVDADIVNIVFLGSKDQVTAAFREAGWQNADPHTKEAWGKNLYALLNNSSYPQQPMMVFLLDGKPEDMDWQNSLNSYGRRDHLRIWESPSSESPVSMWVCSSTHDTSAVLSVKYKGFVHHIAPDIDDERSTVIRDLNFAGCVKSVSYVARPEMPVSAQNATGDPMHSDGTVAVVELQDCKPENRQIDPTPKSKGFKPGRVSFRYIRRQILTYRSDIVRANIIYGAYNVGRMTWMALHHQPAAPRELAAIGPGAESALPLPKPGN